MRTAIRVQFPINNRAEVVEESPRPLEANVSHYAKIFEPGNSNTVNGFQLSSANRVAAQLSSRHTFFGPDGYSGYLPGNISEDSVECNFKLESWRPDATRLYITFDRMSGEYAKTIKLQCEDITILVSNNAQVFVGIDISAFDEVYGTVTMTLSDWSVPGHSFKVTNISFIPDIYDILVTLNIIYSGHICCSYFNNLVQMFAKSSGRRIEYQSRCLRTIRGH